jgi:hypothetical protein
MGKIKQGIKILAKPVNHVMEKEVPLILTPVMLQEK